MATRKKTTAKKKSNEISEEDCKAAADVLSTDYWNDVRGTAQEVARRLKEGEVDRDDPQSMLSECVDNTQRVIYTWQAKLGLLFSNNADYMIDEIGEEGVVKDGSINWSGMMFYAMEQDVLQNLAAHGVQFDDPDSWPDIDLSSWE